MFPLTALKGKFQVSASSFSPLLSSYLLSFSFCMTTQHPSLLCLSVRLLSPQALPPVPFLSPPWQYQRSRPYRGRPKPCIPSHLARRSESHNPTTLTQPQSSRSSRNIPPQFVSLSTVLEYHNSMSSLSSMTPKHFKPPHCGAEMFQHRTIFTKELCGWVNALCIWAVPCVWPQKYHKREWRFIQLHGRTGLSLLQVRERFSISLSWFSLRVIHSSMQPCVPWEHFLIHLSHIWLDSQWILSLNFVRIT